MINKATETASEVEQKAKEMAGEVREIGSGLKEATTGAVQIIVLALARASNRLYRGSIGCTPFNGGDHIAEF